MAGFDIHYNGVDIVEEKIRSESTSNEVNVTDIIFDNPKVNFKYVLKPGIEISYIRKNSIADLAGLKVDDKIISINKKKVSLYKLQDITEILQRNKDETIVVEVLRKGKKIIVELLLKEEI